MLAPWRGDRAQVVTLKPDHTIPFAELDDVTRQPYLTLGRACGDLMKGLAGCFAVFATFIIVLEVGGQSLSELAMYTIFAIFLLGSVSYLIWVGPVATARRNRCVAEFAQQYSDQYRVTKTAKQERAEHREALRELQQEGVISEHDRREMHRSLR